MIYCVALLLDGEKRICEPFDPRDPVDAPSEIEASLAKTDTEKNITIIQNSTTNDRGIEKEDGRYIGENLLQSISLLQKYKIFS